MRKQVRETSPFRLFLTRQRVRKMAPVSNNPTRRPSCLAVGLVSFFFFFLSMIGVLFYFYFFY